MLPIQVFSANQPFLLKLRKTFYINKFRFDNRKDVGDIEHGLSLNEDQVFNDDFHVFVQWITHIIIRWLFLFYVPVQETMIMLYISLVLAQV